LSQWPRLRVAAPGDASCRSSEPDGGSTFPSRSLSASHRYAGHGAGLVIGAEDQPFDIDAIGRLCDIVSVGAVAICPDVAWVRRHFGESVYYYPIGDPAIAADAVKSALADICSDPDAAALRATAARQTFDATLAAEIMLQNAVSLYEQWRERAAQAAAPPRDGASIDTSPAAVATLFARLPDRALASVARSTAALQPLRPHPGWRFDDFVMSPDLAAHVRYAVWLAARSRGISSPVIVPWHAGTRLRLSLDNDLSLALFAGGAFEPNEFALLDRVLQPGMVFLDGGANEGAYTVFAAARVGERGHVVAVEPSAREAARLRANIALNRLRNVTVVEAALAETGGSALLRIAEPLHAGHNTLGAFAYEGVREADTANVPVTTLDELAATRGIARLDVVKLDIEGAELRALSGARRVLGQMRPLLLLEVLEPALEAQGGSAPELLRLLDDADYVPLTFAEATGEPVPLRPGGPSRSDNIIAVHRERDWGLPVGRTEVLARQ
jgi:FkbM family methyltransferase